MTRAKLTGEIARLLSGGASLLAGLSWLATMPLRAVLVILGAMGLILTSAASLSGTEVGR